jgi:SPX domain protein involved in polyphosphate accumulation
MKFCKTLQRAVEISDPSYVPYWTNYKRLKKLVKALSQENTLTETATPERATSHHQEQVRMHDSSSASSSSQHHSHTKRWESAIHEAFGERLKSEGEASTASGTGEVIGHHQQQHQQQQYAPRRSLASSFQQRKKDLESNPREVAFFELLHAEFSKASKFFDKAQQQFIIREEMVSVGMKVLRNPQAGTVKHRWGLLSKAVFLLYRDLLLFEVFAIMTYFAFSKILKKHDKVTGYHTRGAFMVNVVNKV